VNAWEYDVPTVPAGSVELVVIDSAAMIVRLKAFCELCGAAPLSVTRIVKLNEPLAVGIPFNVPLDERFRPAGRDPEANDHVYGDVPPLAVNVWEYDVPAVPAGSGEVVVIDRPAMIVRLKAFCEFCGMVLLSVTRIVKLNEPSEVGVPLNVPLDERLNPPGKEPEANDHVYGDAPPVAVNASL
jgi:hypothetical protein